LFYARSLKVRVSLSYIKSRVRNTESGVKKKPDSSFLVRLFNPNKLQVQS